MKSIWGGVTLIIVLLVVILTSAFAGANIMNRGGIVWPTQGFYFAAVATLVSAYFFLQSLTLLGEEFKLRRMAVYVVAGFPILALTVVFLSYLAITIDGQRVNEENLFHYMNSMAVSSVFCFIGWVSYAVIKK